MAYETISIEQVQLLIANENAVVIDIRDKISYETGHIRSALHIDNHNVEQFITQADHQNPLVVCCYHGNMSKAAADYFNSRGFARAYSLNGGYSEWSSRDHSVVA